MTRKPWTRRDLLKACLCGAGAGALNGIGMPSLFSRALAAAEWHLEALQPDNATNRPWACHVFAILGVERARPDAILHAQTLVHNCMVAQGRPDRRSALILVDAARAIERELADQTA